MAAEGSVAGVAQAAGLLGAAYDPFTMYEDANGPLRLDALNLPPDVTLGRLNARIDLRSSLGDAVGNKFKWDATLYPPGPSGKRGTGLHTNTMHLTKPTKHPREAWEVLKHLTSHEVGVQKVLMESGSPGGRPRRWPPGWWATDAARPPRLRLVV